MQRNSRCPQGAPKPKSERSASFFVCVCLTRAGNFPTCTVDPSINLSERKEEENKLEERAMR